MPDYKQMLKEAEAREEAVKAVFKKYDHDGSGTIDDAEITCVMEDLGLLKGLQSQVTSFVAEMFGRYDDNNDGVLSFEVCQPGRVPLSLLPHHSTRVRPPRCVAGVQEVLQRGQGRCAGPQAAAQAAGQAQPHVVEPVERSGGGASEDQR